MNIEELSRVMMIAMALDTIVMLVANALRKERN